MFFNKNKITERTPKAKCSFEFTDNFCFQKFGEYPHQPKGTEVIISNENASLKEKIKDLQTENAVLLSQVNELKEVNTQLVSRINSIRKLVNYDEDDTQIDD